MTDELPWRDGRVPLSLAVPGWQGSLIPEAVEQVAKGVAIEQDRLRGSRFLVVLRLFDLDYSGILERIEIVSGHADVESAAAVAQMVGAQRLVELRRELDPEQKWKHAAADQIGDWPKVAPAWQGKRLPGFADGFWDGVGWHALEVNVAIIPTDPDNPINIAVINTIDMMSEMVHWFTGLVNHGR